MTVVLDAGAFLAVERGDRDTMALLKGELVARRVPLTHGGVLGQVWRGGRGRQANLARLVSALEITPLDAVLGRRSGVLLGEAREADVIDAALVLLAKDGDVILTSHAQDLRKLAATADVHVDLVEV